MSTVKIRWLGAKKTRVVELPVGLDALSNKTGEVVCNPVGEFPADEAKKLLAIPGASTMFVPEDEYQAALHPKSEIAADLRKEAQRERGRKLAAGLAKKRAAKKSQSEQVATETPLEAA